MEMKWYAIFITPGWEKKITVVLNRKKIIHFCPANILTKHTFKISNSENLASFVFVSIFENEIPKIKAIRGIKNFLYWQHRPAIISEFEINSLKQFLSEYSIVTMIKKDVGFNFSLHSTNQNNDNEAKLIHLNSGKSKVGLPSLGYMIIAENEKSASIYTPALELKNSKINFEYRLAK